MWKKYITRSSKNFFFITLNTSILLKASVHLKSVINYTSKNNAVHLITSLKISHPGTIHVFSNAFQTQVLHNTSYSSIISIRFIQKLVGGLRTLKASAQLLFSAGQRLRRFVFVRK